MKKIGILVGAAPLEEEKEELINMLSQSNAYRIAVDGGIAFFLQHGMRPDRWIGDMDSAKEKNLDAPISDCRTSQVSAIKDETDMVLAVEDALENGCDEIAIFGGTGGSRISHTFANVQMLYHYAKAGKKIRMYARQGRLTVLVNGSMQFPARDSGFISVFSLTDISENVVIQGFFYGYEGDLHNDIALGVSNEYCGKCGKISVENGALLIIEEY